MQEFSLPRTGQTNLAFTGQELASAKSPAHRRHEAKPNDKCHWFEATVYQTKGGKYVLSIAYRWAGKLFRENAQDLVFTGDSPESLIEVLDKFDPMSCVTGYPVGDYWTEKQKALGVEINEDFGMLVEEIETLLKRASEPERIE